MAEISEREVQTLSVVVHQAGGLMVEDAGSRTLADGKRRFLIAWGRLLMEIANWMSVQLHAGILSPADIVGVSSLHIDAARSFLAGRVKQPV